MGNRNHDPWQWKALANFTCDHFDTASSAFIARQLRCWSLIGRIGNGNPFQVSNCVHVTDSAAKARLAGNEITDSVSTPLRTWPTACRRAG